MLERIGYMLLILVLVANSVALFIGVPLRLMGVGLVGSLIPALVVMVIAGVGACLFAWRSSVITRGRMELRLVDPRARSESERELFAMVARNARAAGLASVPAIGIYRAPDANSFSVAASRRHALLVISDALSGPVLETAVYRELLRIARGDTVTMTLLAGVQATLVWPLARMAARLARWCFPDERGVTAPEFSAYHLTAFVLEVLFFSLAGFPLAQLTRALHRTGDRSLASHVHTADIARLMNLLREQSDIPTPRDDYLLLRMRSDRRLLFWKTHPAWSERDRYTAREA